MATDDDFPDDEAVEDFDAGEDFPEPDEDFPEPDEDVLDGDLIEDPPEDLLEVVAEDDGDDLVDETEPVDADTDDDDEAFDELEAEELEMLTEDETTETLVVDEAAEMRAIRRAELAMDQQGVFEATEGEFVCSSCFLVLKTVQLANPRKKICKDCAG